MSDRVPECAACDQDLCVLHDTRSKLDLLGDMARLQGVVDQLRGDKIDLLEELAGYASAAEDAIYAYRARLATLTQRVMALEDVAERAWVLLANAGVPSGDWDSQGAEWVGAAVRWREGYHAHLESNRSVT